MDLCLAVSLSVRHTRVLYLENAERMFWHRDYPRLILHCVVRDFGYGNKGTSLWKLSQTLNLAKFSAFFRHGMSIVASVVDLVRPKTIAALSYWAFTFIYDTIDASAWRRASRGLVCDSWDLYDLQICKQISTPPQPYQKIPHIYFLRSCPLPNLISILSPITIQFVFDVFVLYVLYNFYCTALLCYLVLWPQSWINSTTTTPVLVIEALLGRLLMRPSNSKRSQRTSLTLIKRTVRLTCSVN